jgi:hypothetical protein
MQVKAVSVRSRRLTYLAGCVGTALGVWYDQIIAALVTPLATGSGALLTDFLATAYAQFLPTGATAAAYNAAQQQAAAMFVASPLVQLLYNLGPGVPVPAPVLYPGLNQPPTPNAVTLPAPWANQAVLAAATNGGQLRVSTRQASAADGNPAGAVNSGPVQLVAALAGGSITEWAAFFAGATFPAPLAAGPIGLVMQAPTGIGAGAGTPSPSGCYIDIEYGASIAGD